MEDRNLVIDESHRGQFGECLGKWISISFQYEIPAKKGWGKTYLAFAPMYVSEVVSSSDDSVTILGKEKEKNKTTWTVTLKSSDIVRGGDMIPTKLNQWRFLKKKSKNG